MIADPADDPTTDPATDPPGYDRPTPLRITMPSHSCEECDRCHALVPIWAWNRHVEWHVNQATLVALLNSQFALLAAARGEDVSGAEITDLLVWAAAKIAP